jgi:hypothetical protein
MRSRLAAYWEQLPSWFGIVLALALYLLALNVMRDQVPAGLNNDAAEEALRGVYLLEGARFEAINLYSVNRANIAFGHSSETLFLYFLGAAARLMGTTTLAIHVTTWLFALASIWLLCQLTQRIEPALPSWVPLLLAISSVWLFHYARSGLRANTAPVFLLAFTLLLDRTERSAPRWRIGLACGVALGLSLYGYTSCRVLPIAFTIHALVCLWRSAGKRNDLLRRYAAVLAGALAASIPNILSLWRQPEEFLFRGSYAVLGGLPAQALNVLWTFLLPFYYPEFRTAVGPTHRFDGVSISLTVAGLWPLYPIVGAAFLVGLGRAWSRRRETVVSFLLCAWLTGTVALGISGPSLTRMLLLLPVYLVLAALGVGPALRMRGARPVAGAVLLLMTTVQARDYFVTFAQNPSSRREYGAVATSMGKRARALAAEGNRVLCVVAGGANVVHYLTHDFHEYVRVSEFWYRPANPHEIPLLQFRPQVLLVERDPRFEWLHAAFLLIATLEPRSGFDEFNVDPRWKWPSAAQLGPAGVPESARRTDASTQGTGFSQGHSGINGARGTDHGSGRRDEWDVDELPEGGARAADGRGVPHLPRLSDLEIAPQVADALAHAHPGARVLPLRSLGRDRGAQRDATAAHARETRGS